MYDSVASVTFIMLCSHHPPLSSSKTFSPPPTETPAPAKSSRPAPGPPPPEGPPVGRLPPRSPLIGAFRVWSHDTWPLVTGSFHSQRTSGLRSFSRPDNTPLWTDRVPLSCSRAGRRSGRPHVWRLNSAAVSIRVKTSALLPVFSSLGRIPLTWLLRGSAQ